MSSARPTPSATEDQRAPPAGLERTLLVAEVEQRSGMDRRYLTMIGALSWTLFVTAVGEEQVRELVAAPLFHEAPVFWRSTTKQIGKRATPSSRFKDCCESRRP